LLMVVENEIQHLRVLIANERRDRLALLAGGVDPTQASASLQAVHRRRRRLGRHLP